MLSGHIIILEETAHKYNSREKRHNHEHDIALVVFPSPNISFILRGQESI